MLAHMQYLPARCDACGFVVLVAHQPGRLPSAPCPKCSADVSIFPGAKHGEDERTVFEALSGLLHAAVQPTVAALVLAEIENSDEQTSVTIVEVVARRLPALATPLLALESAAGAERVTPMLFTILRARSSTRSRSGFYRAATSGNADERPSAANDKKSSS
jgi:hypothetical protein